VLQQQLLTAERQRSLTRRGVRAAVNDCND
jgi:hypothetical protein